MLDKIVYLHGYNISEYIAEAPTNPSQKGDYGAIIFIQEINLTGINTNGFWDQSYQYSPFYKKDLTKMPISVYSGTIEEFSGYLSSISSTRTTASIKCTTEAFNALNAFAFYISDDTETPSDIVIGLCNLYNIEYDATSLARSKSIHEYYGLFCKSNLYFGKSQSSVLDALQQLSEIGVARAYFYKGKFYYEAYDPASTVLGSKGISVTLTESDIYEDINISNIVSNDLAGYVIYTALGSITYGSGDINQMKSLSYGYDAPISIITGGAYVGDSYLTISQGRRRILTFLLRADYTPIVTINSFVNFNIPSRGLTTSDTFEITNVEYQDEVVINITAEEVI